MEDSGFWIRIIKFVRVLHDVVMKKLLFVFTLLFMSSVLGAREVYNLNYNWRFFSNQDDREQNVNIPHMWNFDALGGERDYYRGLGNYQKDINVPSDWQGKRVFIRGYGANSVSNLLVNSKYVGEHRGGFNTFTYEITDYLDYGKRNFLWFMVNNAPRTDVLPIAGDANSYGGLFRDVEIIVTGNEVISLTDNSSSGVYIVQNSVTPNKVEADLVVMVNGREDKNNLTASFTVYDCLGAAVAEGQHKFRLYERNTTTLKMPFSIDNPMLWNGTNAPHMYDVVVRISDDGTITDSVKVSTGFRKVDMDADGNFRLNGEPYKLKGVVVHQDRAMVGNALTIYHVKEDFDFIREIGANIVRVAGVAHHPYFYELCDRAGIMVVSDFPLVGPVRRTDRSFINSPYFLDNARQQTLEMMAQQFNHPSVIAWGLFSDIRFSGEDPKPFITELNTLVKSKDPSRFTAAVSNHDGDTNMITDLIIWDHHLGWREGQPEDIAVWQKQMHDQWSDLRSAVSYSAGASIYHQSDSLNRPFYLGNWHPERWQTHFHEVYYDNLASDNLFWAIFAGNMFDYGATIRRWGEGNGINDCCLVTFNRKDRKDAFYFYKANWNTTDPFVYIAERRWVVRDSKKQQIKVYTNQPEAVLFVNGVAQGTGKAERGRIIWKDVELREGVNMVGVNSGDLVDAIEITVRSGQSPLSGK